jgi:hypothetical protein
MVKEVGRQGCEHDGGRGKRYEELVSKANVGEEKANGQTVDVTIGAALHLIKCYKKKASDGGVHSAASQPAGRRGRCRGGMSRHQWEGLLMREQDEGVSEQQHTGGYLRPFPRGRLQGSFLQQMEPEPAKERCCVRLLRNAGEKGNNRDKTTNGKNKK